MAEPMVHHRGADFQVVYDALRSSGCRTSSAPRARCCSSRPPAPARWSPRSRTSPRPATGSPSSSPARSASAGSKICEHYGLDVQRIDYAWGEVPVAGEVGAAVAESGAGIVFCTQSETSTGVVADVQALKAAVGDAIARRRRGLVARRGAARDRRLGHRRRRLRLAEGADVPARARDGERRRRRSGTGCRRRAASTSTGARRGRRRRCSTRRSRRPSR